MSDVLKKLDELREQRFQISIEADGGDWMYKDPVDDEDRPYYVHLYYGDSNAPWKPGTLMGIGRGFTLGEALEQAIQNLKHPTEGKVNES